MTISTNMAGRGTDIILGGNPETLAWAQLKQLKDADGRPLYPTRLDVPDDVWTKTVDEIETKEKMKEEGRKVAEMGGLHIVGTERHEARRIDNQLRGRAGRQGDPGSRRFYLSLQDDLMRIFAGEWVAERAHAARHEGGRGDRDRHGHPAHREGAEEGRGVPLRQPQEPARIRRGDGPPAQARLRQRQEILDGENLRADDPGHDRRPDRRRRSTQFLDDDYGPASFAEFAGNRLGVEFEPRDFRGAASRTPRKDALREGDRARPRPSSRR